MDVQDNKINGESLLRRVNKSLSHGFIKKHFNFGGATDKWQYAVDGAEYEPVEEVELIRLIENGEGAPLCRVDKAWRAWILKKGETITSSP